MSQKYLIRIAELERLLSEQAEALRQKDQQLSLVEETEAFLRSALARAEEKIEEEEREIEHLRAQIEKLRRMLFGNRLHYLADRAGIRGLFSDADAYHLDQAFPLLMKQLELMLTGGELNPRHQHTVTLYAKGLTCEADTLGSCGYVYLAVYPTSETKK